VPRRLKVARTASASVFPIKFKSGGKAVQIVEVLHAAVRDAEFHHGFQLFRDYGFARIREQTRTGRLQQCRIFHFDGARRYGVSKPNINLYRYLSFLQKRGECDPDAFVVSVFLDAFRFDRFGIKTQTVIFYLDGRDFLECANESLWGIISIRKKISVSGRAIPLRRPEFEEQSALQDEDFSIFRLAKPEENSLQAIFREYEPKVVIPLSCEVEQLLSNRGGDVFDLWIAQLE
jgi:hypothetical protein